MMQDRLLRRKLPKEIITVHRFQAFMVEIIFIFLPMSDIPTYAWLERHLLQLESSVLTPITGNGLVIQATSAYSVFIPAPTENQLPIQKIISLLNQNVTSLYL